MSDRRQGHSTARCWLFEQGRWWEKTENLGFPKRQSGLQTLVAEFAPWRDRVVVEVSGECDATAPLHQGSGVGEAVSQRMDLSSNLGWPLAG